MSCSVLCNLCNFHLTFARSSASLIFVMKLKSFNKLTRKDESHIAFWVNIYFNNKLIAMIDWNYRPAVRAFAEEADKQIRNHVRVETISA